MAPRHSVRPPPASEAQPRALAAWPSEPRADALLGGGGGEAAAAAARELVAQPAAATAASAIPPPTRDLVGAAVVAGGALSPRPHEMRPDGPPSLI